MLLKVDMKSFDNLDEQVDRLTKKPRVWVYHDKETGEPTGECTITYNDADSQTLALQTYDGEKLREEEEGNVGWGLILVGSM